MRQTFEQLRLQRDSINNHIIDKLHDDKIQLKIMADSMAEAATNIQGQGYAAFLSTRDTFLSEIDRIVEEYSLFMCAASTVRVSSPK
jgi:hypothetical protein